MNRERTEEMLLGHINMKKTNSKRKATTFLQKTYEMVSDLSNSPIVSWTPDGIAFGIQSVADFTENVLPKYFAHSNYASFVRQLNMYDFHKTKEGGAENVFRHPFFIKGRKHLLRDIHRKSPDIHSALSPSACEDLLERLNTLQSEHQSLEQTVSDLRGEKRDMAVHNKDLLAELDGYKQREENLESLLMTFSSQLRSAQDAITQPTNGYLQTFEEERPKGEFEQTNDMDVEQFLDKELRKHCFPS